MTIARDALASHSYTLCLQPIQDALLPGINFTDLVPPIDVNRYIEALELFPHISCEEIFCEEDPYFARLNFFSLVCAIHPHKENHIEVYFPRLIDGKHVVFKKIYETADVWENDLRRTLRVLVAEDEVAKMQYGNWLYYTVGLMEVGSNLVFSELVLPLVMEQTYNAFIDDLFAN